MAITIKNLHSQLPEDQLHEAKGFTTASNNTYLKKNQDGSSEWLAEYWLEPVLGVVTGASAPPTESTGHRYIITAASGHHADWDSPSQHEIVEFDGTSWVGITAVDGMRVVDLSDDSVYYFNTAWAQSTDANTNLSTTDLQLTDSARFYDVNSNALVFQRNGSDELMRLNAGSDLVDFGCSQVRISGQAFSLQHTLTDGATITPDWNDANVQKVVLGGNRAIANPSNIEAGATYILILVQDGTGSRTITSWGTNYKFSGGTAPTLTTTGGQADVITLVAYSSTILMCTSVLNFATS